MKKLRGEEKRPVDKVEIYDNNVRIMPMEQAKQEISQSWEQIYRKHSNGIKQTWDENTRNDYRRKMEAEINEQGFNENKREHLEMAIRMSIQIKPIKTPGITNRCKKKKIIRHTHKKKQ